MNIVIVEDEIQTALDLRDSIERLRPDFKVKAVIDSVESALTWFSTHGSPDLIFSDIQLGDGLSFEIYKTLTITCPVIFCTAFDEYAMQAFKNNGIDYLLKPVADRDLISSLEKIEVLKRGVSKGHDDELLQRLLKEFESKEKKYKNIFLITYRDKLIPMDVADIKLFGVVDNKVHIYTDNKIYYFNETLDTLERQLNPIFFYRANRQHIVSFNAIKDVAYDSERKLSVGLKLQEVKSIIISKAKAADFLKWIKDR